MSQDIEAGKKKALIVAISDYANLPTDKQLPFCKNDGESMYDLLKTLGYDISESNKLVGKVNWQTMRDALRDFFIPREINSKDTLLFYFSGHGLVDGDGTFYLATSEIDPQNPFDRGIDDLYLRKVIDASPSNKIALILDSCYSGKLNPFSKGDDQSAVSSASSTIQNMNMRQGRFLLAACKGYQEASGTPDGSKFTQYVIEGLKGKKESVNKDGYVTPSLLADYVNDEMSSQPEKDGRIQRPIMKGEGASIILTPRYEEFVPREEPKISELLEEIRRKDEEIKRLKNWGKVIQSQIDEPASASSNLNIQDQVEYVDTLVKEQIHDVPSTPIQTVDSSMNDKSISGSSVIVVSDIHLGYSNSNYLAFEEFLDSLSSRNDVDTLVILGDLFDMWRRDVSGLFLENSNIISKIVSLKKLMNVFLIAGDHDYHLLQLVGNRYPLEAIRSLDLQRDGIVYRFMHGWEFDPTQTPPIMELLCHTMSDDIGSQRKEILNLFNSNKGLVSVLKERSNLYGGSEKFVNSLITSTSERPDSDIVDIEKRAYEYSRHGDLLVFGHTHSPFVSSDKKLANCGSWLSNVAISNTYLEIRGKEIHLMQYGKGEITNSLIKEFN